MDPKSRVSQGKPSKPAGQPKSNFETMLEVGLRSLEGSARAAQFDRMVDALELLALSQYCASPDDTDMSTPIGKRMGQLAEKIATRTSPATFAETMAAISNGSVHHCTKCKTQHGGIACPKPANKVSGV